MRRLVLIESILVHFKKALAANTGAQTATMTNAPTAGNPTKWIEVDDNGTALVVPAWPKP